MHLIFSKANLEKARPPCSSFFIFFYRRRQLSLTSRTQLIRWILGLNGSEKKSHFRFPGSHFYDRKKFVSDRDRTFFGTETFQKRNKNGKIGLFCKKMVPGVLAASPDCFSSDGDQCLFIYQDRKDPEVDFSIGARSGRNGIGFFRDSEIIDSR